MRDAALLFIPGRLVNLGRLECTQPASSCLQLKPGESGTDVSRERKLSPLPLTWRGLLPGAPPTQIPTSHFTSPLGRAFYANDSKESSTGHLYGISAIDEQAVFNFVQNIFDQNRN